ncbi:MAG: hypothetical protein KDB05_32750, partial [Planctomycetales bacterium]|nr:hypothetical protein [Planctomycetales bacterium]
MQLIYTRPGQLATVLLLLSSLTAIGCWSSTSNEVVIYSALDREFSEPILDDFTTETGVKVLAKYDVESTKTVGLTSALIQERSRPRCDVFWNNEILHTLRLEQEGLLDAYESPAAVGFPEPFSSPDHTWQGFAARARVLIINTELLPEETDRPNSVADLADS